MLKQLSLLLCFAWIAGCGDKVTPKNISAAALAADKHWPDTGITLIYDGDLGPDPCDYTTLSMLHEYHRRGMINVIGIIGAAPEPLSGPVFDLYNRIYGNRIPIGAYDSSHDDDPYGLAARLMYQISVKVANRANPNREILRRYKSGSETKEPVGSPVSSYRRLLANAADSSVTLFLSGQLFNLHALLQTRPDQFSPLTGMELAGAKLRDIYIMGGHFPASGSNPVFDGTSGAEYNFWALGRSNITREALRRLNQLGKPVTYIGYEVGAQLQTGNAIIAALGTDHPSTHPYTLYRATSDRNSAVLTQDNPAFDEVALFYLAEKEREQFFTAVAGEIAINPAGANSWNTESSAQTGRQRYVKLLAGVEPELIKLINSRITGHY